MIAILFSIKVFLFTLIWRVQIINSFPIVVIVHNHCCTSNHPYYRRHHHHHDRHRLSLLLLSTIINNPNDDDNTNVIQQQQEESKSSTVQSQQEPKVPGYGLYEVHEEMLIQRGIYEEELMNQRMISTPLLHVPPPKRVTGFGSTSTSSSSKSKGSSNKSTKTNKSNKATAMSSSSSSMQQQEQYINDAKHYASILHTEGLVRIDNVIPSHIVDDMKQFVTALRIESIQEILQGQQERQGQKQNEMSIPNNTNNNHKNKNQSRLRQTQDRFANVLLRHNRCDLKIPLGENNTNVQTPVIAALYNVLCQSPVSETILQTFYYEENRDKQGNIIKGANKGNPNDQTTTTNTAILYELSCLISDVGSHRQVIHPDNPMIVNRNIPTLLTCFIALQDITIDMGPTIFLPRTHNTHTHDLFQQDTVTNTTTTSPSEIQLSPKDILLRDTSSVVGILPKGSCVIYDSRLLHCGSANRCISNNDTSRAIFYFSFRHPDVVYPGNPPSIRNDLQNEQLSIHTLQNIITNIHVNNAPNLFNY